MNTYRYYLLVPLLVVIGVLSPELRADQDMDFRIQQRDTLSSRENEQALIEAELEKERLAAQSAVVVSKLATAEQSTIKPSVSAEQLGPALHRAVKYHQWALAENLLDSYLSLAQHDPMLVHYASGALARQKHDYKRAENHYLELLELQPHFLPAELELARVWYEDRDNQASRALFHDIASRLPSDNPRAAGVRQTVNRFIDVLDYRDQWQGALSFGPTYNDNLNLSSEDSQCLFYLSDGQCFLQRSAPPAKSAYGIDYDASVNRRFSLSGHHGVQLRSFAYGSHYQHHNEHNQQTVNLALGYSYQNARHQFNLAPQFEYRALANQPLYAASGLKADWMTHLSASAAAKLELEGEYLDYRPSALDYQSDWQWAASGTYWQQLPEQWLVFGGLDWTLKQNRQAVHEYQIWGARAGVNKTLAALGTDLTLFASLRQRSYGDYSALLGETRQDLERSYTLIVTLPALIAGIRPVIEVKANQTDSNVDWVYSYQQHQYSFKLEKRF